MSRGEPCSLYSEPFIIVMTQNGQYSGAIPVVWFSPPPMGRSRWCQLRLPIWRTGKREGGTSNSCRYNPQGQGQARPVPRLCNATAACAWTPTICSTRLRLLSLQACDRTLAEQRHAYSPAGHEVCNGVNGHSDGVLLRGNVSRAKPSSRSACASNANERGAKSASFWDRRSGPL